MAKAPEGKEARRREARHLSKENKFSVVLAEFEAGTLKSASGKEVTSRQMALAIAFSEARKAHAAHSKRRKTA